MKDNVLFLNMFALYRPSEGAEKWLAQATIRSAELDPAQRRIELELDCPGPVPGSLQTEVCRAIEEVYAAKDILKAAGLRKEGVNIISCPTCGRTRIDLIGLVNRVDEALKN